MAQATGTQSTRWQEIVAIWQKEQWLYGFVGVLAGFIVGIAASGVLGKFVTWFWDGFWSEALGIAITVIVLDRLNRLRAREEYKLTLFRQSKSRSNDVALEALDQIQHENWLETMFEYHENHDGYVDLSRVQWGGGMSLPFVKLQEALLHSANLQEANLWKAELQAARLGSANLQGAILGYANLKAANLNHANLQVANLMSANLQEAIMWEANLQNANLMYTDLQGSNLQKAILDSANLQEANLCEANLLGAILYGVGFTEKTVLPDAEYLQEDDEGNRIYTKYWTPDIDMSRYTDPNHPDFWQPEWAKGLVSDKE
jgi:uncharacterized protein YjbI with pentapeptide repeats